MISARASMIQAKTALLEPNSYHIVTIVTPIIKMLLHMSGRNTLLHGNAGLQQELAGCPKFVLERRSCNLLGVHRSNRSSGDLVFFERQHTAGSSNVIAPFGIPLTRKIVFPLVGL